MKFLAIERPEPTASAERMRSLLKEEAAKTWEMRQSGVLREIFFNETHDAVLILETADRASAEIALAALPLVRAGQIRFDLMELRPYDGWSRLFART